MEAYIQTLLDRFSNPSIGDQIARLCLDGSAKFPKFLLPTVRAQLDSGGPIQLATLALAGWCQYLTGPQDHLATDPLLAEAVGHAVASRTSPEAFLDFAAVFGTDLREDRRFRDAFTSALRLLRERGVQSAVETTLGQGRPRDDRPTL